MSRFKTEIQLNKPESFIDFIIKDFFSKEGFVNKEKDGESFWQYGTGLLTAPQFIKYTYENGVLDLEVWLKFALLPGVYCGEMGLKGFFGAAPKATLRKKIDQLITLVSQPLPTDMPLDDNYNLENENNIVQPIQVLGHDTSSKASLSLIFGLISLIGYFIPIVGIVLGCLGIVNAKKALRSSKAGLATAGLVISIIGIIISVLSWIIGIINVVSTI